MCGIAGIVVYQGSRESVDESELLAIREGMHTRGPDGCGSWLSDEGSVGLAHRRLSIIDLTDAGAQPMSTPDKALRIVFNGEIYNYRELRSQLEKKGYVFRSNSDTEVLLHLYADRGAEMVGYLRGMFAFAIWDERKKGMFLARDHFGIKPLYFSDDGRTLRFASQVKALLRGGRIDASPEPAGHVGFFLWGAVPEPYTLYRGIRSLPAGHCLWVGQGGSRRVWKYFDVAEELGEASENVPNGNAAGKLREALRDSIRHHMIADVPVGVFLSSGLDSSTIAAVASECTGHLHAVTLGFRQFENTVADEVPLARNVAAYYGLVHHVSSISGDDFRQECSSIMESMDQPSIDGVNTYFVSREAVRSGLKVALSGVGADELLGGYPSFNNIPSMVSVIRPFSTIPLCGSFVRYLTAPMMRRLASPKYAGLLEYGGTFGGAYMLRRGLFMPWELPSILDGEIVREGWAELQPVIRLDNWLEPIESAHARVSAMELSLYMRNMLLRDSDWAGMAHSIEIRTPFVDIGLFRALAPFLSSRKDLPSKRHLRDAPNRSLPAEILNRPKTGFSIPVREWMRESTLLEGGRGLRGWAVTVNPPEGL